MQRPPTCTRCYEEEMCASNRDWRIIPIVLKPETNNKECLYCLAFVEQEVASKRLEEIEWQIEILDSRLLDDDARRVEYSLLDALVRLQKQREKEVSKLRPLKIKVLNLTDEAEFVELKRKGKSPHPDFYERMLRYVI